MPTKPSKAILSVCWDRARFYFVIAKVGRKTPEIVTAKSGSWEADFNAEEAAERITEELARHKVRKPTLVVGVGRTQVDSCSALLPPATPAEIPQMVRNEVGRQFGELPDSAIVDYDLENSDGNHVAHAFVLRPESTQNIDAFASAINLEVHSILLRQYSVASLFGRVADQPDASALLLNVLDESADLMVVQDRKVVTGRTIHYGKGSGDVQVERLSAEILRTIAAKPALDSSHQLFVFGRENSAADFAAAMRQALPYDVEVLDPLAQTDHSGIRGSDPSFPMAALVGMVRDTQANTATVDFANPKEPAAPPNRWRKCVFYSAAAAVAISIVAFTLGEDLKELNRSIDDLQGKLDHQKNVLEKLEKQTVIVDAADRWQNAGVNWLDEIRDLAVRFPPETDAIVDRMSCTQGQFGGTISMGVRVREPSIVGAMESALRDNYRQMRSKRITQADQGQAFPCQFETTFVMRQRPRSLYLEPLPSTSGVASRTESSSARATPLQEVPK